MVDASNLVQNQLSLQVENPQILFKLSQAALRAPPEVALLITHFHSFFSVFCFWPTSGKLLRLKICFPQYFGIVRSRLPGPPLVPGVFMSVTHKKCCPQMFGPQKKIVTTSVFVYIFLSQWRWVSNLVTILPKWVNAFIGWASSWGCRLTDKTYEINLKTVSTNSIFVCSA